GAVVRAIVADGDRLAAEVEVGARPLRIVAEQDVYGIADARRDVLRGPLVVVDGTQPVDGAGHRVRFVVAAPHVDAHGRARRDRAGELRVASRKLRAEAELLAHALRRVGEIALALPVALEAAPVGQARDRGVVVEVPLARGGAPVEPARDPRRERALRAQRLDLFGRRALRGDAEPAELIGAGRLAVARAEQREVELERR